MRNICNMSEYFPIHQTAPGPDFGKPAKAVQPNGSVKEYKTLNPIPEGTMIKVEYGEYIIEYVVNMNYYTNEKLCVFEVCNVTKRPKVCRPRLTKN